MSILVNCPHCATRVLPMAGRVCPACRRNVDAPPDPKPEAEQAVEETYRIASQQVSQGVAPSAIKTLLTERGVDAREAATVVNRLEQDRAGIIRHAALKNMSFGAAWCLGGLIVTALTYNTALVSGGRFVVAWGAILVGGIQFLRGLFQLADTPARDEPRPGSP